MEKNDLINIPSVQSAIEVVSNYAKAELEYKKMKEQLDRATDTLLEQMDAHGITKFTLDESVVGVGGTISLAERVTYKADDLAEVSRSLKKTVLDTAKVRQQTLLRGKIPKGVKEVRTKYIVKRLKGVSDNG